MELHPNAPLGEPFVAPTPDEIASQRVERHREAPALTGTPVSVADVQDLDVGGVPVRVYVPHSAPTGQRGVVVYLHGGGWVFGSVETADGSCRRLADASGCVVVSVDYALSPEATWPRAMDDARAVVDAVQGGALSGQSVVSSRVVVAGDSAGGFLATVVARRARDDGRGLAGQALVYPVVRRAALAGRGLQAGTARGLSVGAMQWYWDQFLGGAPVAATDPDVDPMAADLAGLPPTLVLTAEHDILRPEGEAFAQALQDAGVDVVLTQWHGVPHGFFSRFTVYPAAAAAVDQVAAWCGDLIGGRVAGADST